MADQASASSKALNERLLIAIGDHTNADIARITGLNAEMIRRCRRGKQPSCRFLIEFTIGMNISADWLLHGRGPMKLTNQFGNYAASTPPSAIFEPKLNGEPIPR